jgi:hypothetical protein
MDDAVRTNDAAFATTVRICGKCLRKLDAPGNVLRKAAKTALADLYGEDVTLEKVDCFSLCPKGGVVLETGGKRQVRRLLVIEPGSEIDSAIIYLLRTEPN